jgi:hypothetical protein
VAGSCEHGYEIQIVESDLFTGRTSEELYEFEL